MVLADYTFLDVLWSMLVFFLWVAWFILLFHIVAGSSSSSSSRSWASSPT
jgi:hypothetical protein